MIDIRLGAVENLDDKPAALPASRTADGGLVPLSQNHQIAIATYQTWTVKVPSQYSIEDLTDPTLWRKVELGLRARSGRPRPGDMIRCIADDGTYDAFFVIQQVDGGYSLVYSHGRLPDYADESLVRILRRHHAETP